LLFVGIAYSLSLTLLSIDFEHRCCLGLVIILSVWTSILQIYGFEIKAMKPSLLLLVLYEGIDTIPFLLF
jgi:hypothetical protein